MASPGWADIANDLLFLLAERVVSIATFIRLSAVCKSWYSVASATECCKPIPWLMLGEEEGSELRDFYDHSTGEIYQLHLPQAQGTRTVGCAHGWLITVSAKEGDHFVLLNPLDGTQMSLPCTNAFPSMFFRDYLHTPEGIRDHFICRAACSPIEPIVAATHMGEEHLCLSYCRLTDKEWTTIELLATKDVGFVGSVLLIGTISGEIYSVYFPGSSSNLCEVVNLPHYENYIADCQCYFVECDGAIFVVEKIYELKERNGEKPRMIYTKGFKVFRLDISKKKLNEVKNIGDYAFFVGMNNSISLRVSMGYGALKKNSIYFVDDRNEQACFRYMRCDDDVGIFSLDDGSIIPLVGIPLSDMKIHFSVPTWISVNFDNMLNKYRLTN